MRLSSPTLYRNATSLHALCMLVTMRVDLLRDHDRQYYDANPVVFAADGK